MQSIENKILSRIYGRGRGWAFTASDFSRDFSISNVEKSLSNLQKKGPIRRVLVGVYDYPNYSKLLDQELSPNVDEMAQAISRKFNWRIQASGDAALNLLGLSTQVPSKFVYLSDGPNRSYTINKTELKFEKSALKEIGFKYKESGLIVHALKALGKERINEQTIQTIRNQIAPENYRKILNDTKRVTVWVHELIRMICKE